MYVTVMCDHITWSTRYCGFSVVLRLLWLYERFRKVCPQCNIVVHAMEYDRSTRLRKVCPQCNTVVHVKRWVCDCDHAFASKKRKAWCIAVGELAGIPLLAHSLSVKISPCHCSHSSLAGRIAALCGHSKCDLLLTQAHPRMIQHLSSKHIACAEGFALQCCSL